MSNLLSLEDIDLCNTKTGETNKLAFGVMLNYFRSYIRFPSAEEKPISIKLISTIALQLDKKETFVSNFGLSSRTSMRYHQDIRKYLGYREANNNDALGFKEYMINKVLPHSPSNELLTEQIRSFFRQNKIALFKSSRLERYIASAKHTV